MSLPAEEKSEMVQNVTCPYVRRALTDSTGTMLTIAQFIQVSEFPVDRFMLDTFYRNLDSGTPMYVSDALILWCGFRTKKSALKHKKSDFNTLLKQFVAGEDYWVYSNKEYVVFYKGSSLREQYPHPREFVGKHSLKHLILSVRCLKMVLLTLNTPVAHSIRMHFILLEELVFAYMKYQCTLLRASFQKEFDQLKQLPHVKEHSRAQRIEELEAALGNRYRVGVVYFICEVDAPHISKIGHTFNLKQRLSDLQVAHYKELVVKTHYLAQFPAAEEARLHALHKSKHVRGEWYAL